MYRSPRGGNDALTADDQALWEVLVSLAYDDDRSMQSGVTTVAMGDLVRYLGGRPKRQDVKKAFSRLKATEVSLGVKTWGRYYEKVSLLQGWLRHEDGSDFVEFSFPGPIRELMASQRDYAYIELAALPAMESKYSANLYRRLAYHASCRPWQPGGDNTFTRRHTPDEIADMIGFPRLRGKLQPGKLRERFLSKAESDLSAVKAFSTKVRCVYDDKARGRPLKHVEIEVTVNPPSHRLTRVLFRRKRAADEPRIGGVDLPEYRVASMMWRKGFKAYRDQLFLFPRDLFELWSVALDEALTGQPLTDGYGTRSYRGPALLEAIKREGADDAAWGLMSEEADRPDLAPAGRGTDLTLQFCERIRAAEARRRDRVDWKAVKKRKAARKDSAPKAEAEAKDSTPPPPPVRMPPPPPAFLRKTAQAPTTPPPPVPAKDSTEDSGCYRREVYRAQRAPDLPADMPSMEGANVAKYEADMRAWLAARRAAPATAGGSPVTLSKIPVGTVVDDIPF